MSFANPSWLWALTGLAIPLAIHLLSRKEGKVIRVGSLRHVEESNTSQFKSIRLNEFFLLLLRILLVTLLVLFMSGAQCSGPASNKKLAYFETGINENQLDSLVSQGYELHQIPEKSYWTFAEHLNKLSQPIVVVSFSNAKNFTGRRVPLNDNIKWITAESPSREFQALAWKVGDSVFVRKGRSNSQLTSFSTEMKIPDSIKIIEPHEVNVNSNDKLVVAALNVLQKLYKLPIRTSNIEHRTTNIEVNPGIGPLVERISHSEIRINKPLDQDIALNNNLVIELFKVLYPELQAPEVNKDARVLPDEFAWSSLVTSSAPHLVPSFQGVENYLILLFALTLAAERFVAIRRNQ